MEHHTMQRPRQVSSTLAVALLLTLNLASSPLLHSDSPTVLEDFTSPTLTAYGSWTRQAILTNDSILIRHAESQGGLGRSINLDLSRHTQDCPAIMARVGPANQAASLRLTLRDAAQRSATWIFPLPPGTTNAVFMPLLPRDAAAFATPHEVSNGALPDLTSLRYLQLAGDWQSNREVDLEIDALLAVPPDASLLAAREAATTKLETERQARDRALATARTQIRRGPHSPSIQQVTAAAPDYLTITLREGIVEHHPAAPYPGPQTPAPEAVGIPAWVWSAGVLRQEAVDYRVQRGETRGWLAGAKSRSPWLWPDDTFTGEPLLPGALEALDSYTLESADDPAYAPPAVHPVTVNLKTRPTDHAQPSGQMAYQHEVYLRLPFPLREGARYTLAFPGLNTLQPAWEYLHDSRSVTCQSIHVNQVGHHPADPFKQATLSLWLGTGGNHTFHGIRTFQLLDATHQVRFEGVVEPASPTDTGDPESPTPKTRPTHPPSCRLDFSRFQEQGEFRVHIPGLGSSVPFTISQQAWLAAFKTSMQGLRSIRADAAPQANQPRPRPILASTLSLVEADARPGAVFPQLYAAAKDRWLTNAWGGYHDAEHTERRIQHLWAAYLLLELADCFPAFSSSTRLDPPLREQTNAIPDLLDEALWNLDFFTRLQEPNGGVRGGLVSSSRPRAGELTWHDSRLVVAAAPDPVASFLYAGCAARAARLLPTFDAPRAADLADRARQAWHWAEQESPRFARDLGEAYIDSQRHARATAAVELLALTSEASFDQAFMMDTILRRSDAVPVIEQQGAVFAYARLPAKTGSPELKQRAAEALVATANMALAGGTAHPSGISTESPALPELGSLGYYTVPGIISRSLPRAHYLTHDPRYLAGVLRSCNHAAGANLQNLCFTTGLGAHPVRAPWHLDSWLLQQPPPAGLTVLGPSSLAWLDLPPDGPGAASAPSRLVPEPSTWPTADTYLDLHASASLNGYTVDRTVGPTAYTWGYLAACGR